MMPGKRKRERGQRGIALFMVMSAVAMLTVLIAELTYSTQINSRMSYNSLDNLKGYYLAKAAFKLSELRLKAYLQVKNYLNANKAIKDALPAGTLDKIWSMPLIFPLPIPPDAGMAATESIKEFMKKSTLPGTYTASIIGEASKLNLNMLMGVAPLTDATGASGASGASGTSGASGASGASGTAPATAGASGASGVGELNKTFRVVLVQAIQSVLDQKKDQDREFADIYRNVQGEDIVTAIEYYLFPDRPPSNLPGFKPFTPKLAPFYSLSELHLIPGIDDEIYKLLEGILTVYSTAGININTIDKRMLLSLIPEMTAAEADDVLRHRDDPDVGQPWQNKDDFWQSVGATSAGKNLDAIKKRLSDAGVTFITDELSFKISVLANVGQSTRRLEAWVILDPNSAKQTQPGQPPQQGALPGTNVAGNQNAQNVDQQDSSAKPPTGVNLVYWRML